MSTEQQLLLDSETVSKQTRIASKMVEAREELYQMLKASDVKMKVDPTVKPQGVTWAEYFMEMKGTLPFTVIDKRADPNTLHARLQTFIDLQSEYYKLLTKQDQDV